MEWEDEEDDELKFDWDEEEDDGTLGEGKPWGPLARAHRAALDLLRQAVTSGLRGRRKLEERLALKMEDEIRAQIGNLGELIQEHGSLAEAMSHAIAMGTSAEDDIVEMRDKMTQFSDDIRAFAENASVS